MSWLLDIIIIAIIGCTVFSGYRRGFVKTAVSLLSFFIAILITALFADPLAAALKETWIGDSIEEFTEEKITNIMYDNSCDADQLLAGENEDFNDFVDSCGFERDSLSQWYSDNAEAREDATELLAEKLAEPIVDTCTHIIAVIILYVGSQIVVSVIGILLDNIMKLPILKTFNKTFGILLGAVLSLIRVCLFCFIMKILMENGEFLANGFFTSLNADETFLFNIFSRINIFSFFI